MSGRYEITDRGERIDIKSPDGRLDYLDPSTDGRVYLDDIICGAIRQQARDIAELEVFAEIGRRWNADSSLAKWFPLTAERVEQDAQEIAKLRADLAAAVAERNQLRARAPSRAAGCGSEIARLQTDLELARIGARRYQFMWQMSPREFEAMWCQVMATCAQFDELVDAKIADNELRRLADGNGESGDAAQ